MLALSSQDEDRDTPTRIDEMGVTVRGKEWTLGQLRRHIISGATWSDWRADLILLCRARHCFRAPTLFPTAEHIDWILRDALKDMMRHGTSISDLSQKEGLSQAPTLYLDPFFEEHAALIDAEHGSVQRLLASHLKREKSAVHSVHSVRARAKQPPLEWSTHDALILALEEERVVIAYRATDWPSIALKSLVSSPAKAPKERNKTKEGEPARLTVYSKPRGRIWLDGVKTDVRTPNELKITSGTKHIVYVEFEDGTTSAPKTVQCQHERCKVFIRARKKKRE